MFKAYQYSLNGNKVLSDEQRWFFEKNGFLVLKGLISENVIDELTDRFESICNGKVPHNNRMTIMKEKSLLKMDLPEINKTYKIQDFIHDDVLCKYFMNNELLNYVEAFVGSSINVVNTMIINKPPDAGQLTSRHPLHQDLFFFPLRPANRLIAAWTAMENACPENGCLFVIPGSHRVELLPHEYPEWEHSANYAYYGVPGLDYEPRLYLPMRKGDTVLFHPQLMHGSGANVTKGFRKAITCHFASTDCHYIDWTGTLMDSLQNDIKNALAKKGITNWRNIEYYWRPKTLLVRGFPGKL